MRQLLTKYNGTCHRCKKELNVGDPAMYEKSMGIFCPGCEPKDTEEIRHYRQIKADIKAERYESWAAKRREKAGKVLQHNERYTGDIAFNTQPGHIPLRARVIKQNDRAYESLTIANHMENKAESLRHVRVAGDAAKRDQAQRDLVDTWIKPKMMVDTCHYGILKVLKVNQKTVTLQGRFGIVRHDKMFITQPKGA